MAKRIVEYIGEEKSSGRGREVMSPYLNAPPLAPINAGAEKFAAMGKLGAALTDIGEYAQKIQIHNEEIIGRKTIDDFNLRMVENLNDHKNKNRGTQAMRPEFIDEAKQMYDDEIQSTLGSIGKLSPRVYEAVSRSLAQIKLQGIKTTFDYQTYERHKVEKEIIDTDFLTAKGKIKGGGDAAQIIANHKASILRTSPGNTALAERHAAELSIYAAEATKNAKETEILLELHGKHNGDLEKILKEVETKEFLEKHGKEIRQDIRYEISAQLNIQEQQYNKFATQKVGAVSVKIMNGLPITIDDTAGLRSEELATIEKIRDYQTRQNRAESRAQKQQEAFDRAQKSNMISGEIEAAILSNSNEYSDRLSIYKKVPEGLDILEANRLVAMAEKIFGDPKYKDGIEIIKKAFKDGAIKPEEYKDIVDTFRAQVDAAGINANAVKIANDLMNPKKTRKIGELLDAVRERLSGLRPDSEYEASVLNQYTVDLQGGQSTKDVSSQPKMVTIDGKKYKDGDIIVRNGKKFRVTIK